MSFRLSIEPSKSPFCFPTLSRVTSIKYLCESSIVTWTSFFQNSTNPPPFLPLQTSHLLSKFMLWRTRSSLASSAHVSAKNTIEGSFARIMFPSSFFVRRFPSPRQFHTKRFMTPSGAKHQPPPFEKKILHHPSKHVSCCKVIRGDHQLLKNFVYIVMWYLPEQLVACSCLCPT